MKANQNGFCIKQSRQVRRFTSSLENAEAMIIMGLMAHRVRYALPSRKPRITAPFKFNDQWVSVVWRYHGERTARTGRKIIYWDYISPVPEKSHGYFESIKVHAVATAIVSMLGAGATYAYQNWTVIVSLISPAS